MDVMYAFIWCLKTHYNVYYWLKIKIYSKIMN